MPPPTPAATSDSAAIAVAQDAGPRPARTRRRRVRQVAWALLPIVSLTFLAWWPFLVLALIRRQSRDWAVFAAYLAAVVAEIVTFAAAGILPMGSVADYVAAILFYAIILLVVITATVHTLVAFRPAAELPYLSDAVLTRTAAKRQARAASGIATICEGQGLFLRANDADVLVRNVSGKPLMERRIGPVPVWVLVVLALWLAALSIPIGGGVWPGG